MRCPCGLKRRPFPGLYWLVIVSLLIPGWAAQTQGAEGDAGSGQVVAAIRFSGLERASEGLKKAIMLKEGEPFTANALEQSIKLLERKALFSSVSAHYRPSTGGVVVTFELKPIPRLGRILVKGNQAITDTRVMRRIRIRPGQLLTDRRVSHVAARVQRLYRDEGFAQATVAGRLVYRQRAEADLLLLVQEGRARVVDEVELTGQVVFSPAVIRKAIPIRAGERLGPRAIKESREALLGFYRRRGYFEAEVAGRWKPAAGHHGAVIFSITAGTPFPLRIEGNRALSSRRLLSSINLYHRPVVTAGTWRELARRIGEAYRAEGFALVEVETVISGEERQVVTIKVKEGPRVRVSWLRFTGNRRLPDKELKRAMRSVPGLFAGIGKRGVFVEAELKADVERIKALYRAAGYMEASVNAATKFVRGGRGVGITIDIDEGPGYFLRTVKVSGTNGAQFFVLPEAVRPGRPYYEAIVAETRRFIRSRLAERGHAAAGVTVSPRFGGVTEGMRPVDLDIVIEAGPVFHVGAIVVAGNTFTREHVLRRELELQPGEVLDQSKATMAEEKIYRLGFFRSARIDILPSSVTDDPLARDIVVRVTERPAGKVEYGFGYDSRDGLRSFGELSHGNLRGTGRRVSLRASVGFDATSFTPNEYLGNLGLRVPRVWDSQFALRGNVIPLRSQRAVDEFSVERVTLIAGAEREWRSGLRTSWQLEFENGRVFDVAPDALLTSRDKGHLQEVTLNPLTVFDSRDDPFSPTRGIFESLRLRYGVPALGSDVHFLKMNAQHSQFLNLGAGVVGLYSVRFGYARSLGNAREVPIRERFFLGGRTSVRGFDENEIGPRGEEGNPTGGDLLINLNSEVRIPVRGRLRAAVFVDAGGLYLSRRSVSLGDFRRSAGVGIRYLTPVGPISLDYGFKLDKRRGEPVGQLHFSIGNLF